MNYDQKCQLLVIGDSTVGKTSILSRFANGTFNSNYLATVGLDNFTKDEIIDNKTIRIKIWDTAGQERYKSLTKSFFRNAQGVMLVYDVTNSETYDNLKFWMQSIKNNMSPDMGEIPIIIVGNKIDCDDREVNAKEAESFWKEQGYPYFETSAKTGENIDDTIKYLVKRVIDVKEGKSNIGDNNNNIVIDKNDGKKNDDDKKCAC
jgi:small GTP-binding protein